MYIDYIHPLFIEYLNTRATAVCKTTVCARARFISVNAIFWFPPFIFKFCSEFIFPVNSRSRQKLRKLFFLPIVIKSKNQNYRDFVWDYQCFD